MSYRRPSIVTIDRKEFIGDINLSLDSNNQLKAGNYYLSNNGGNLPNDRFLYGLDLQFEGRFTNPATGQPTGTTADGQFALLNTIKIGGLHRPTSTPGNFIDVYGATLREMVNEQLGVAGYTTGTLSTTASANSDIRFITRVPFTPLGIPLAQQIDWLLDAPNYDNLQLQLVVGDATAIYTGQTGNIVASAYGSSSGVPRVRVYGLFAQAGVGQFQGFLPGRVWRYNYTNTSSQLTTTGTKNRLANLPRGNRLRGFMVKTGTLASPTAGLQSFDTLSDGILTNIYVMRGLNKAVLYFADPFIDKQTVAAAYGLSPADGYMAIDWCEHGTIGTAFDATQLAAGPTGDVDFFVQADTTGASSQAAEFQYEELRGVPSSQ